MEQLSFSLLLEFHLGHKSMPVGCGELCLKGSVHPVCLWLVTHCSAICSLFRRSCRWWICPSHPHGGGKAKRYTSMVTVLPILTSVALPHTAHSQHPWSQSPNDSENQKHFLNSGGVKARYWQWELCMDYANATRCDFSHQWPVLICSALCSSLIDQVLSCLAQEWPHKIVTGYRSGFTKFLWPMCEENTHVSLIWLLRV